jgi:signal transduction histidine kinase
MRARLILASVLWTGGLLLLMHLLTVALHHVMPRFNKSYTALIVLTGVLAMAAGFGIANASLRHLRFLRERVIAVRKGAESRVEGDYPSEVQPLIDSLNELIADREKSIARAHAAAGDLAHALKTPLALLKTTSSREAIDDLADRMKRQVDYQLTRARVAASGASGALCPIAPCVAAITRTVSKLYAERQLEFVESIPNDLTARVRGEDLEEILGNVLDNACKWARKKIEISAAARGGAIEIVIDDDGPGLPETQRLAVIERGVRLDETAPGSGLGLAIVRDLVDLYGGTVALETSEGGGLRARIGIPAA